MAQEPMDRKVLQLPEGGKSRRVYLLLKEEISRGVYSAGDVLPGEQKLALMLEVSRVTVRRALDGLAADGLITRRAGSGTVVSANQEVPALASNFSTLMPQLVDIGQRTTARLLSFSYCTAPEKIALALNLPASVRVQKAERLRLVENNAFSHLTTWVPETIAQNYTEADLAALPLFRLLERSGVVIGGAHQSVTATLAAPDVAEHLGVSVGAPLLALDRIVRDADGLGVEYLSALYRPDMFRLEMELSRVGAGEARHWEPVIGAEAREAAE